MLTMDLIHAAQDKDITAVGAVVAATEDRIINLAAKAAKRMAPGGPRFAEYRDEFAQVGRIAVWEALPTFKGDTVDSFFAYMHRTIETKLLDAVGAERYGSIDKVAVYLFGTMVAKADGDLNKAEQMVQTDLPPRRRFSAERANEVRMAFQGTLSMDFPVSKGTSAHNQVTLLIDTLADVPADLMDADDWNRIDRQVKADRVHSILDQLGDGQRAIMNHSFGIGGAEYFGWKRDQRDDEGMAEQLGTTPRLMQTQRSKAWTRFAALYMKDFATSDEEAEELAQAAIDARAKDL